MSSYYESNDLKKFAEVGAFATNYMDKFWSYYNDVMGGDSSLTKREKSLIALAVAFSKQCPYCIDAYTNACLENGSNPEQMHEVTHIVASMEAGIKLVHGVQMQNILKAKGVM
jgi:alkylhydroperoxidase/carboxymuconolactone decarboxylase family protein